MQVHPAAGWSSATFAWPVRPVTRAATEVAAVQSAPRHLWVHHCPAPTENPGRSRRVKRVQPRTRPCFFSQFCILTSDFCIQPLQAPFHPSRQPSLGRLKREGQWVSCEAEQGRTARPGTSTSSRSPEATTKQMARSRSCAHKQRGGWPLRATTRLPSLSLSTLPALCKAVALHNMRRLELAV